MKKFFMLAIAILLIVSLLSVTRNALASNQASSEKDQALAKIDPICRSRWAHCHLASCCQSL